MHRPDAALVFSSSGLSFVEKGVMVVIARLLGVRGILMPRSGPLRENLESSRIMRLFARMVFLCAYRVVCQSEGWRSYFLSLGSNESKLEVVENWIPGSSFASSSAAVAKSEQETFVVGFFSRVEIEKGIFDYLEAIRRAHIREPHIRGLIYGDGSAMPAVEAWIRENDMGGVILCGGWLSADMKFERLRRLDALLFASHSEGFPNSVLEAVAMKVPIISVRVGAVEDFLVHQESSLLATIGDVEDLASHVLTLATEESFRIRYACAAYERAVRQNTERCAVERIAEVLS
nr:glycosyltransferase family 4 protein [Arenimonas composti]